ncbi:MAG: DNA polymerase III subunit alpha [Myxococcota bacterium]
MGKSSRFAHLHLHTQYSILDGAIGIERLIERCCELGLPAVAMTDHGNMFGTVQFHRAAVERGIRPIIGCEVYVAQGSRFDRDPDTGGFNGINHMVLLAMNATGYANLVQLVSRGFLEGFYYKPRVDLELLRAHSEGLIATSGCLSGAVPAAILAGRREQAWQSVETFARLFPDRYYLELQRHGIPAQDQVNAELLHMHEDLRLPLLATNDAHYLTAEDAHPHEALLCVQTGKTLDDPGRFRFTGEGFYVKSAEEMLEVFHDQPRAVANSVEVAERCGFELETGKLLLPEFSVPAGHDVNSYLRELAGRGLRERLGLASDAALPDEAHEYRERLEYELGVISRCGYAGYFLIVWDFVRYARERGIPVGPGRGSAAGSLVAYVLRIVDIDPIEYRIPFERFLNPERVSMPDIDMDFCMNRRGEVIRYVEEKYNGSGEEGRRVAGIVTFGTMQARAVVRDVGRVMGMPFADVDRIAKLIPSTLGIRLDEALAQSRELREAVNADARLQELFTLARSLEGQIRNPGKHAAGIVISSRPLLETVPLYRDPRTGEIVTQFDYRDAERVGLIKFDLLGLRTLTVIDEAVRRIRQHHDPDFRIEDTDLGDPETYALLSRGDTEGIFQVGQSSGMTQLVVKVQARHFRDLIPLVALYRPGPLQSGMVDDYVERRHGRTRVSYPLPELEEILSETYGVILYQDQVLQIANRLASFTLGEGDLLRRAMGKKIPAEMEKQRARFIEGGIRNGHPADKIEQIFNLMYQFAGYGFGKAHSAAYALLTHQTAYLKAHYAAEFYAAIMSAEWREHDRLDRYMKDAAARGIAMLPPSVNESDADFGVAADGGAVRFGLRGIKNVGEGAVEAILEARGTGGPFKSLFDLCRRVDTRRVNRRVLESLIRCGAFDFQGATRAGLMQALAAALERAVREQRDRASGQSSLFGEREIAADPAPPQVEEWGRGECLAAEKEILGFYVTGHPLDAHERALQTFSATRLDRIPPERAGQNLWLGGIVSGLATQKTRRGGLMARARLEDLGGTLPLVLFPRVYDEYSAILRSTEPLLLRGTLQIEEERPELHVDQVLRLAEAWERLVHELEICVDAERVNEDRLLELRKLLDLAPGGVPVRLELRLANGAEAVLGLRGHQVAVSEELVQRVDRLFSAPVTSCRV